MTPKKILRNQRHYIRYSSTQNIAVDEGGKNVLFPEGIWAVMLMRTCGQKKKPGYKISSPLFCIVFFYVFGSVKLRNQSSIYRNHSAVPPIWLPEGALCNLKVVNILESMIPHWCMFSLTETTAMSTLIQRNLKTHLFFHISPFRPH